MLRATGGVSEPGAGVGQLASWLGLSQTPASAQSSVTWDKRCPRGSPGESLEGGSRHTNQVLAFNEHLLHTQCGIRGTGNIRENWA